MNRRAAPEKIGVAIRTRLDTLSKEWDDRLHEYVEMLTRQHHAIECNDCDALEQYVEIGQTMLQKLHAIQQATRSWREIALNSKETLPQSYMTHPAEIPLLQKATDLQNNNAALLKTMLHRRKNQIADLETPHKVPHMYPTTDPQFIDRHI